jgi:hypothetical protein
MLPRSCSPLRQNRFIQRVFYPASVLSSECSIQRGASRRGSQQIQPLGREGFATATGLVRIGVSELESTPNQGIAVIQHKAVEVQQAFGIANHLEPIVVVDLIAGLNIAGLLKIHGVGHARTATIADTNPQTEVTALLLPQIEQMLQCRIGHLDAFALGGGGLGLGHGYQKMLHRLASYRSGFLPEPPGDSKSAAAENAGANI